ncbi:MULTISPECIES: restriction endonuclease subunit S [Heyndrickxia]|uniref:restriction endonuclease subunit S n=2 Tax=Bacillaceae TaxID=186817 RepID=UPI002E1B0252|nr:restriction endonuclease subunit S [Weizmannia sp. CD-2023]MED4892853.1 restriction endonuclease subunit S [Weizmannia sp. CD-2023]
MEQKNMVPKRRFKEFQNTSAWEQRKLGKVVKTHQFRPYLAEPNAEGDFEVIQQGDRPVAGYTNGTPFENYRDVTLFGDHTVSLYKPTKPFFIATDGVKILSADGLEGDFLFSLLERYKPEPQGYKRHFTILKNQGAWITKNVEEQVKIGAFFKNLDHLITLHQCKLEKMKTLKSAYLSEMFPAEGERVPKRRFAGFTQAWEQRKWEDTVDISTNMVDPRTGLYDELPHIGPGNIESFTGKILDNVLKVKDSNLISGKFHFYKGDIIYGKINPQLGKYAIAPCEGLASADSYILNAKNGVVQNFLYSILQTKDFYKYSVSVSSRTGMPKINRDELNVYNYKVPEIEEQKKIGSFFVGLDNLITLHQRKLEKLQNIKKAYLNEMFV